MIHKNFRSTFSIVFSLTLYAALFSVNPPPTLAAGGSLDATFSGNGKLTTDFGTNTDGPEKANDVAVQTDGKIVAVGNCLFDYVCIARYNSDGTLDTTFSGDGRVSTQIPGNPVQSAGEAVAIQSNGRIVVAGTGFTGGDFRIRLIRYNANGTLDTTFDGDGIVTSDLAASKIQDIALQSDGKIVIVGTSFADWLVARFNSDGSPDTGFSGDGIVTTDFGGGNETAQAVTILSNGRILAAGTANPGGTDFALALYATNGTLDTSFDGDGKAAVDFSGTNDVASGMKVQPDGKIVVAGSTIVGGSQNFALARFNANGSLDTSFDTDGKVVTNVNQSGSDAANDVALQADGKIVAVGDNGNVDFTLARYHPNGSLDNDFGQAGIVFTDIVGGNFDTANAVAIQTDGKIVVAGGLTNAASGTNNFVVARYLPNSAKTFFDYDGDGKADVSVFRPSNGTWYLNQSNAGFTGIAFGQNGDKITPADFDGDGKTDIAVYRSGVWYLQRSAAGFTGVSFGAGGDVPQTGDFDGDGKSELAVYRPSNGIWYLYNLASNQFTAASFGAAEDKPLAADYDGDGRADIAVFRPSNGTWYLQRSSLGFTGIAFGVSTDKPTPADYDGDGKTDVAVYRASVGTWYLLQSTAGFTGISFGAGGDIPTAGDYDGDGRADVAVFRPGNGVWYLNRSTSGFIGIAFGAGTDLPAPAAFVP